MANDHDDENAIPAGVGLWDAYAMFCTETWLEDRSDSEKTNPETGDLFVGSVRVRMPGGLSSVWRELQAVGLREGYELYAREGLPSASLKKQPASVIAYLQPVEPAGSLAGSITLVAPSGLVFYDPLFVPVIRAVEAKNKITAIEALSVYAQKHELSWAGFRDEEGGRESTVKNVRAVIVSDYPALEIDAKDETILRLLKNTNEPKGFGAMPGAKGASTG